MSGTDPATVHSKDAQQEAAASDQAISESATTNATEDEPLFTGSCFCGSLTFTVSSLPVKSYICHCLDCRRITATSFAHNISFPFSSLTITTRAAEENPEALSIKPDIDSVLSTYGNVEKGRLQFCKHCGTRLFLFPPVGTGGKLEDVVITVGTIDGSHEDKRLKPKDEGFCKRREAWMPDMRGTNVFEEW